MALGVTVTSSGYTVGNNLPTQLYELVMGGMLATAFLPVYLSVRKREGRAGSNRYTSNLLSIVLAAMGILTLVGIVFAAQVVWTQSFGANADFDFDLAVYFFRFFSIEVMLYALSSVVSGVLNAERDYLWSNAAPIFNNIVCTSSFFLYAALVGTNPGLALLILALGNPLGVAVQCVMQLPSLRRHGIRLTPHIDFHDPALKETLSIGIPSLVVTICSFVTVSVQTSSALSVTVSGSSIAYYTRIWYTLPYSIFAIPITTAMFTELSNYVSSGDMGAVARGVASGTRRISFTLIPFALYLMVFATPLITLMAAGKFEPDQVDLTARYLVVLSTSLPMYGVCTYLQKVCSSLRRMNLYMVAIVVGSILQVVFCLALTPLFGLMMVPLSSLFFFTVVDVVTFVSLRRQLGSIGLASVIGSCLRALALGGAGAVVGMGVLFMLGKVMGPIGSSAGAALVQTVLAGVPAVAVTFGLSIALGLEEVSTFRDLAGRLVARLRRAA
jgi:putative peptidoglycan lipid II flippase